MSFKDTTKKLQGMLEDLAKDLIKAEKGNKTAAQRVRTGTIKLAKLAKIYRKESLQDENGDKKMKPVKKKTSVKKKAGKTILYKKKR